MSVNNEIPKYIGRRRYFKDGTEMKSEYMKLAINNQKAAELLKVQELYSESVYMYIQSMEKKIKSYICGIINVNLPYYADELRRIGHSLSGSISFLIKILSRNNAVLEKQLEKQLLSDVFEEIFFSRLYNECRYPNYHSRTEQYSILNISLEDCKRIERIAEKLDKYLNSFNKL